MEEEWIGLRGRFTGKPPFFMEKSMVSGVDFETNPLIGGKMGDLPRAMVRFYEEKMMGIVICSLGDFIDDFVAGNGAC